MVAITSMNLIDVQAIVSNIMAVESLRGDRLAAQKSTQNAQIVALQELNTSMAAVGTAAQAITSAARWVPPTTAVAFSDSGDAGKVSAYSSAGAVSWASPYPFSVTSIVGGVSATATISNTFSGLADFPGLTITVSGVTAGTATVTPSATTSSTSTVMTTAAQNLVTALNTTLNLIKVQTAADGVLETSYTPKEVSQNLLSTAFDSNTLASLADTGINLTKFGSFTFDSSVLSTAYDNRASTPASLDTIGQVAAFAARVDAVATAATSVTGSLSREVSFRQSRVSDLTQQIVAMNTALTQREKSLTVFYSELNAKISSLQSQQSYLQTTLDVFVKALTKS